MGGASELLANHSRLTSGVWPCSLLPAVHIRCLVEERVIKKSLASLFPRHLASSAKGGGGLIRENHGNNSPSLSDIYDWIYLYPFQWTDCYITQPLCYLIAQANRMLASLITFIILSQQRMCEQDLSSTGFSPTHLSLWLPCWLRHSVRVPYYPEMAFNPL